MEGMVSGWAAEWVKQGALAILSAVLAAAYWFKDRELQRCQKLAREDSKAMTEALVKAAAALDGATDNNKSWLEANKLSTGVLQALIKQVDMSDDRARERADRIVSALERRGGSTRG